MLPGPTFQIEARYPSQIRIEEIECSAATDKDTPTLGLGWTTFICDGTNQLEYDRTRGLFFTAPAPRHIEDIHTRMGLDRWFAIDVLFAKSGFERLTEDSRIGDVITYRVVGDLSRIVCLNRGSMLPVRYSTLVNVDGTEVEVSRTAFFDWRLNPEVAPFVHSA